ncbi:MAG: hypothetical protein KAT65_20455 [Methanophagales archaeon]|nr:hypothetical protein [Methanophagales archaeon]
MREIMMSETIIGNKGDKRFDLVIIGAGPGGLFAAYKIIENIKNIRILVLDKGKEPSKRICPAIDNVCENCKVCNLISGGGGAGLFSDGKLTLDLSVGGYLKKFIPHERRTELEKEIKEVIEKFSTSYIYHIPSPDNELLTCLKKRDLNFKPYPVIHLGSDNLRKFISNFISYLQNKGVKFSFDTSVFFITNKTSSGKWLVKIKRNGNLNQIESNYLIVSAGKEGNFWFSPLVKELDGKVEDNNTYLGIRLEINNSTARPLYELSLDPKIYQGRGNIKIKTHCFCRHGQILLLKYFDLPLVGGHTPFVEIDKNYSLTKFPNSNFAILYRDDTICTWERAIECMKKVDEITGGNLLVQRLGDYLNDIPTTKQKLNDNSIKPSNLNITPGHVSEEILPGFKDNFLLFLEHLSSCVPDILNPDNLIYAPAIEWWMKKIEVNKHMEVYNLPDLYAIGDGSGLTQGIVQSAAAGIIAAENVLMKKEVSFYECIK